VGSASDWSEATVSKQLQLADVSTTQWVKLVNVYETP